MASFGDWSVLESMVSFNVEGHHQAGIDDKQR